MKKKRPAPSEGCSLQLHRWARFKQSPFRPWVILGYLWRKYYAEKQIYKQTKVYCNITIYNITDSRTVLMSWDQCMKQNKRRGRISIFGQIIMMNKNSHDKLSLEWHKLNYIGCLPGKKTLDRENRHLKHGVKFRCKLFNQEAHNHIINFIFQNATWKIWCLNHSPLFICC